MNELTLDTIQKIEIRTNFNRLLDNIMSSIETNKRVLIPTDVVTKRTQAAKSLANLNISPEKIKEYNDLCAKYDGLDKVRELVNVSTVYAQVWFFLNFLSLRKDGTLSSAVPESWEHLELLESVI